MGKKLLILIVITTAVLTSCSYIPHTSENPKPVSFDLDSIIKRGKLIAVTELSSTNYFIYKGEPMGFHYELLKKFTDHLGIELEIVTENQLDREFKMLNSGEVDLLATGLTVNSTRKKEIEFTEPILETKQVLVQRKPRKWRSMTEDHVNRLLVRNQLDLAHKTVYVREGSSHALRLRSLEEEIGDSINIVEVPFDDEELIKNVAEGEIDYTITDENIGIVNTKYYPDIDISTPVSFYQNIAWGVRRENSEILLRELDKWIVSFRKTRSYALLYAKYFKNSRSGKIIKSDYYSLNTGKISQWDAMIKNASIGIHWDWRLLASLICQESHFNPSVKSQAGAYGLMQVMPVTGENFGIDITSSPANNIKAGTKYISRLEKLFRDKIPDEDERLKFILASYNAGPGHILDAMRLAEKHGSDPHRWDGSVSVWLRKKSDPRYYNDTIVKNGYFRGVESVNFVSEILERYDHYKNLVPEEINGHLSQVLKK